MPRVAFALASVPLLVAACTSLGGLSSGGGSDVDAGDDAADAASSPDAGGVSEPKATASIVCGGGSCVGNACCFERDAGTKTCAATCSSTGLPIPCDDAEDCTVGLCCVNIDTKTNFAARVTCRASCPYTSGVQTNLCDPNAATPCPNGGSCQTSNEILPGFFLCK